jgi:hypothetical protein
MAHLIAHLCGNLVQLFSIKIAAQGTVKPCRVLPSVTAFFHFYQIGKPAPMVAQQRMSVVCSLGVYGSLGA